MTFEQFERRLNLVRNNLDRATWAHYTVVYIREAGHDSDAIHEQLNRHRRFWNHQMDALHCSLFMALGRLFETKDNAMTLSRLLNESSRHAATLFSREALRDRKTRAGLSESAVIAYMQRVTADPVKVLRRLKKHLVLPRTIYQDRYQDIRHLVYGHEIAQDSMQPESLYADATFREVEGILYRAHEVLEGLFELGFDGRERDLSATPPTYPARIKGETFRLLNYVEGKDPT